MKSPVGMRLAEFAAEHARYIKEECEENGVLLVCRSCSARIILERVFLSIHDTRFEGSHAGEGLVWNVYIPFCPTCEDRPQDGCLHLDYGR